MPVGPQRRSVPTHDETLVSRGRPHFRWSVDPSITRILENVWRRTRYPALEERKQLAADIGVTERCIRVYFQNRRQKERARVDATSDGDARESRTPARSEASPRVPARPPPAIAEAPQQSLAQVLSPTAAPLAGARTSAVRAAPMAIAVPQAHARVHSGSAWAVPPPIGVSAPLAPACVYGPQASYPSVVPQPPAPPPTAAGHHYYCAPHAQYHHPAEPSYLPAAPADQLNWRMPAWQPPPRAVDPPMFMGTLPPQADGAALYLPHGMLPAHPDAAQTLESPTGAFTAWDGGATRR